MAERRGEVDEVGEGEGAVRADLVVREVEELQLGRGAQRVAQQHARGLADGAPRQAQHAERGRAEQRREGAHQRGRQLLLRERERLGGRAARAHRAEPGLARGRRGDPGGRAARGVEAAHATRGERLAEARGVGRRQGLRAEREAAQGRVALQQRRQRADRLLRTRGGWGGTGWLGGGG